MEKNLSNMKVALLGNPNAGKTSIFNQLTGLNQKVGNFAGVTVEKKTGTCQLTKEQKADIIDLPGTYSLYPKSFDEQVVLDVLLDEKNTAHPDVLVVVVDASNLKRNLLLFSELKDLEFPLVLVFNMADVAEKEGFKFDIATLEKNLDTKIVLTNARTGEGLDELKAVLASGISPSKSSFTPSPQLLPQFLEPIKARLQLQNDYRALLYAHHFEKLSFLTESDKIYLDQFTRIAGFQSLKMQSEETVERYRHIGNLIDQSVEKEARQNTHAHFTKKLDKLLLHPFIGYFFFLSILFVLFQAIYTIADYPVQWIEQGFEGLGNLVKSTLPEGAFADLLTDGIIAGIGGVVVFVPQIAILFGIIAILEETGYMTRVMVMMDKLMQKFGLNGRSVVPLISGVACAIPAIMSARSIDNWKERMITMMVTPLMSCSARLPIYTVIIGLVVPDERIAGIFNLQGLALMGIYLLGVVMALVVALVFKLILKAKDKSYFIMELPTYKVPRWKNVGITMFEKSKTFVWEAGKVIVVISIILWVMAYYSPDGSRESIAENVTQEHPQLTGDDLDNKIASVQLEQSYAGYLGRFIEPAIKPLGYDWKIGIALITSFAAREVFVGTMATIYSIGSDDELTVSQHMAQAKHPETGKPLYDLALGFSLLVFYAFAMQCMSTVAVMYKETKSLKYPMLQLVYMTTLAYVAAWLTYSILK